MAGRYITGPLPVPHPLPACCPPPLPSNPPRHPVTALAALSPAPLAARHTPPPRRRPCYPVPASPVTPSPPSPPRPPPTPPPCRSPVAALAASPPLAGISSNLLESADSWTDSSQDRFIVFLDADHLRSDLNRPILSRIGQFLQQCLEEQGGGEVDAMHVVKVGELRRRCGVEVGGVVGGVSEIGALEDEVGRAELDDASGQGDAHHGEAVGRRATAPVQNLAPLIFADNPLRESIRKAEVEAESGGRQRMCGGGAVKGRERENSSHVFLSVDGFPIITNCCHRFFYPWMLFQWLDSN